MIDQNSLFMTFLNVARSCANFDIYKFKYYLILRPQKIIEVEVNLTSAKVVKKSRSRWELCQVGHFSQVDVT